MTIGIDIDGVILDYERILAEEAYLYDLEIGGKGIVNYDAFSPLEQYRWSKEEKDSFIKKFVSFTYKTPLVLDSKEVISWLKEKGIRIVLISARGRINPDTKKAVLYMLEKYNISYDSIYLGIQNKGEICKKEQIDYMIDDNPFICQKLVEDSILTIYFKQSHFLLEESNFLHIFSSWIDIKNFFLNLLD